MGLNELKKSLSSDITLMIEVSDWCNTMYSENFLGYFQDTEKLFKRLKSKSHPITDEELEYILIDIPIMLFDVSEKLNEFRINQEVMKMCIKKSKMKFLEDSETIKSISSRQAIASYCAVDEELLLTAYKCLVDRVDQKISFCKELIMGAKKIWDARRQTDASNPVSEVTEEDTLPVYNKNMSTKEYIR